MRAILSFIFIILAASAAQSYYIPEWGYTYEKDGVFYIVFTDSTHHLAIVASPETAANLLEIESRIHHDYQNPQASPKDHPNYIPIPTNYYKGDVYIPDSIEYNGVNCNVWRIFEFAFCGCDSLTSVRIPPTVRIVETKAFSGCSQLKELVLPDSIYEIGAYITAGTQIKQLKMPSNIIRFQLTPVVYGDLEVIFSDHIPVLEKGYMPIFRIFSIETELETFVLPKSRFALEDMCFFRCSNLKSLVIPEVECFVSFNDALIKCDNLTEIISMGNIPPKISTEYMDPDAWQFMPSDSYIHFPYPLGVSNTQSIPDEGLLRRIGLVERMSNLTLVVPAGSEDAYAAAEHWSEFDGKRGNRIVGVDDIEEYVKLRREQAIEPITVADNPEDCIKVQSGNGTLTVTLQTATPIPLTIYNLSGRCVHTSILTSCACAHLPGGVYIVQAGDSRIKAIVR